MEPLASPHCLELPNWHHQFVLSWYLHQPESHQLSFKSMSYLDRSRPIDRTPGIPVSDKKPFPPPLGLIRAIGGNFWLNRKINSYHQIFIILSQQRVVCCLKRKQLVSSLTSLNITRGFKYTSTSAFTEWFPIQMLYCKICWCDESAKHNLSQLNVIAKILQKWACAHHVVLCPSYCPATKTATLALLSDVGGNHKPSPHKC